MCRAFMRNFFILKFKFSSSSNSILSRNLISTKLSFFCFHRPRFLFINALVRTKKVFVFENGKQRKPKKHKTKKRWLLIIIRTQCLFQHWRNLNFSAYTFCKHSVIFFFYLTSFSFITFTMMTVMMIIEGKHPNGAKIF